MHFGADIPFVDLLGEFGLPVAFGHDVSSGQQGDRRRHRWGTGDHPVLRAADPPQRAVITV